MTQVEAVAAHGWGDTGWAVLNALADSVLIVAADDRISYANASAEEFFGAGVAQLCQWRLQDLFPGDNPLFTLVGQVRAAGRSVSEYEVTLETQRIASTMVTMHVAPLGEPLEHVVVTIHQQSMARKIDRQLVHRNAARSVSAMSAILAHEVRNPLSGIRGAAQLMEQNVSASDRELTRLICDEVDRICALVDRFDIFSDRPPIQSGPVNIHEVLGHVRKLAENGFGRKIRFIEYYDPSLPDVHGNRDELIQVFLNLVKNAAEAAPNLGGEIILSTAYRHGIRLAVKGTGTRVHLPLIISVQDNGDGIPEDLHPHLFDPFVTTKTQGTGLGLALVAKIVGDHGGVVEFESRSGRTLFEVMLPMEEASRKNVGEMV